MLMQNYFPFVKVLIYTPIYKMLRLPLIVNMAVMCILFNMVSAHDPSGMYDIITPVKNNFCVLCFFDLCSWIVLPARDIYRTYTSKQ